MADDKKFSLISIKITFINSFNKLKDKIKKNKIKRGDNVKDS